MSKEVDSLVVQVKKATLVFMGAVTVVQGAVMIYRGLKQ